MWYLWSSKWHWERIFPELFSFAVSVSPLWLCRFLHHLGMNKRSVGGHSSETWTLTWTSWYVTSLSRDRHEKLIVSHLVKLLQSSIEPNVNCRVHKTVQTVPEVSQVSPGEGDCLLLRCAALWEFLNFKRWIPSVPYRPVSQTVRPVLTLSSHASLGLQPFRLSNKNLECNSRLPMQATCPDHYLHNYIIII
jgi:hypothetical protein